MFRDDNMIDSLDTGPKPPDEIFAVIEVPKGSRVKYKYEKINNEWVLKLDRVLFSPVFYVGNYGIIPKTYWDNSEPLNVLVLMDEPVVPGTVISCKPVAILEMLDFGVKDDKILAVSLTDPHSSEINDLNDLNKHLLREITHFFETYKELEGKKVEVLGWKGAESAKKAIIHAQKVFKTKS